MNLWKEKYDAVCEEYSNKIEKLQGQTLALKIGLEQLRGADVSDHVRNHIERVLASVQTRLNSDDP